jgi:cytochrome c biogenesis protein CcdA
MNTAVQSAVLLGIWWCALIDAIGNWVGQDYYPPWVPIIWGTVVVLVIAHVSVLYRLATRSALRRFVHHLSYLSSSIAASTHQDSTAQGMRTILGSLLDMFTGTAEFPAIGPMSGEIAVAAELDRGPVGVGEFDLMPVFEESA